MRNDKMQQPKILVVDDSEMVRTSMSEVLDFNQFQVTTAASVTEALHLIDTESFDVLVTDLSIPGGGDGFTVVSAIRHTNPDAVTLVYTGYPELEQPMDAILLQADEVLVRPTAMPTLVALIHEKLEKHWARSVTNTERVAFILERDALPTITDWLSRVERDGELTCVPLSKEERTGCLLTLLQELVHQLRTPRNLGTKQVSESAVEHGKLRQSQGYSVPMVVKEFRILQVSIFGTLQNDLSTVDVGSLLTDVMTIAGRSVRKV